MRTISQLRKQFPEYVWSYDRKNPTHLWIGQREGMPRLIAQTWAGISDADLGTYYSYTEVHSEDNPSKRLYRISHGVWWEK